jgi:hypothetical protein
VCGTRSVPVKAGDKFVTYDGAVSGTAVELTPSKIVLVSCVVACHANASSIAWQLWRLKAWPAGVEARVTMSMRFENSKVRARTRVRITY